MTQKIKFGGSKMGRIMKRLINVKGVSAQTLLEIYWKTTVDFAAYVIDKHKLGKKLSPREQGIVEFIEIIVDRIEKSEKGEHADAADRNQAENVNTCCQEPIGSDG